MSYFSGAINLVDVGNVVNSTVRADNFISNNISTTSKYILLGNEYNTSSDAGIIGITQQSAKDYVSSPGFFTNTVAISLPAVNSYSAGDLILVSDSMRNANNYIYEVASYSAGVITINIVLDGFM